MCVQCIKYTVRLMVRVSIVTWNNKDVMIGCNNFISKPLTSLNVTSVYIEDVVW